MRPPRLKLFARLFILFGFATLLLTLLIVLVFLVQSEKSFKEFIASDPNKAYQVLTHVVALPPDIDEMHEASQDFRGDLMIFKDGQIWSTNESFPTLAQLQSNQEQVGEIYFSKYHGRYYLFAKQENYWIAIRSSFIDALVYPKWLSYWPWVMCILVILSCYLLLKYWLRPIQQVIQFASEVSNGDFDSRISEHPNSELSDLTHSINHMARDLGTLFNAKRGHLLSISHELKTPLARSRISLTSLPDGDAKNEIDRDLQQMEVTINQLLEIERLSLHSAINKQNHWLPTLVNDVLKKPGLSQNISTLIPPPDVVVKLDKARFQILLRNLLENAGKYGGESQIELSFNRHENTLILEVRDHGNGMTKDEATGIFDPFFRIDRHIHTEPSGKGLGLYLCKCIVLAHNGTLDVESEYKKGSCFTVTLPVIISD